MGEGRYGLGFEGVVATPVTFVPERSISNPEPIRIASRQHNDLLRSSSRAPPPAHIFPSKHTSLRVKLDPNSPLPRHSRQDDSGDGNEDVADDYDDDETAVMEITDGRDIGKVEEGMYLKSKLWWLGMVLIAVGEGGNFLSYGFAPASVVAPLGTVALIANCIFAPLILGERFRTRDMVGMALAIIGAVTVVQSSSDTSPRLNPDQLLTALTRLPFLLYTLFSILLLPPLVLLSNSSFGPAHLTIDVGICALFGGFTVLATKALSSLLSGDFIRAWKSGVTWACLVVVGGTSLGQIRWLNRALMRFQSKEVIPTQFVFFTLAVIIGSAVLYQEFRDITRSRLINFAFGVRFFYFLLPPRKKKKKDMTLTRVGFPRLQQFSWASIFLRLPPLQFLWRKTKKATNYRPSNLMNTSQYRTPHLRPLSIAFSVIPLNGPLSSAQSPLPRYLSLRVVSAV
uniref:Unplaced genomic scaffold supercont1.12, whole genome shotgun sequence n=1 Tax=Cryptococcus bacillisporus CA1280 TaxID=1296109 RepID=A0A0D0VIQ1_CRYGA|nr:hypothetical protein I312_04407 [Cryptococcus bacillisporus CA1280]